jgi:hypothetical protein
MDHVSQFKCAELTHLLLSPGDYEERICGLKIYNCIAHDLRATCHVFVQNKFL